MHATLAAAAALHEESRQRAVAPATSTSGAAPTSAAAASDDTSDTYTSATADVIADDVADAIAEPVRTLSELLAYVAEQEARMTMPVLPSSKLSEARERITQLRNIASDPVRYAYGRLSECMRKCETKFTESLGADGRKVEHYLSDLCDAAFVDIKDVEFDYSMHEFVQFMCIDVADSAVRAAMCEVRKEIDDRRHYYCMQASLRRLELLQAVANSAEAAEAERVAVAAIESTASREHALAVEKASARRSACAYATATAGQNAAVMRDRGFAAQARNVYDNDPAKADRLIAAYEKFKTASDNYDRFMQPNREVRMKAFADNMAAAVARTVALLKLVDANEFVLHMPHDVSVKLTHDEFVTRMYRELWRAFAWTRPISLHSTICMRRAEGVGLYGW